MKPHHFIVVNLLPNGEREVFIPRALQHRVTLIVRDVEKLQQGAVDPLDAVPLSYLRGELRMTHNGVISRAGV